MKKAITGLGLIFLIFFATTLAATTAPATAPGHGKVLATATRGSTALENTFKTTNYQKSEIVVAKASDAAIYEGVTTALRPATDQQKTTSCFYANVRGGAQDAMVHGPIDAAYETPATILRL